MLASKRQDRVISTKKKKFNLNKETPERIWLFKTEKQIPKIESVSLLKTNTSQGKKQNHLPSCEHFTNKTFSGPEPMLLDDKGIKCLIQAVVMMHKPFVHEKINDVQIFVICNEIHPYLKMNNTVGIFSILLCSVKHFLQKTFGVKHCIL